MSLHSYFCKENSENILSLVPKRKNGENSESLAFFFPPPSVESHASLTDFFVMITSAETFHYTDWMESFSSSKFHRFF